MTLSEQIKQKLTITDVVGSYITITKAGRNYKAVCPFHAEDTPSMMVSPELQIFKCFGCGKAGDIFRFVQEIEGVDFFESQRKLAEKAGIEIKNDYTDNKEAKKRKLLFEINEVAANLYNYLLTKHPNAKEALEYIKVKRNLTNETIEKFKIGYSPDKWDFVSLYLLKKGYKEEDIILSGIGYKSRDGSKLIDKFRNRIMFPFIDVDGKILGFTARALRKDQEPKYLNTNDTPIFHKNLYVYALDKAKISIKKEGAIFVEGQMDVISSHQAGITNTVASSGTALTTGQLKIIKRYTSDLVFCFDSDSAGVNAAIRSISLAEKENFNVKIAQIPYPYKDLDEYVQKENDAKEAILNKSIPAHDFYLVAALKKNSKNDPHGKKKIIEELAPIYSQISNKVVQEHYIKKLAEEINSDEQNVRDEIIKNSSGKEKTPDSYNPNTIEKEQPSVKREQLTSDEFFIAVMLNLDFDSIKQFMYKVSPEDLPNEDTKAIFKKLIEFMENREEFDIEHFIDIIDANLRSFVSDLYMWDFGEYSTEDQQIFRNLNLAIGRIKKDSIKRELKLLTEKIKLAEMEKNTKSLETLQTRLIELSKELLNYEKNQ